MPLSALLLLPFAAISAANVPLFVSPTFRTPSNSTGIKALQSLTPPPVTCLTSPPLSLRWIRAASVSSLGVTAFWSKLGLTTPNGKPNLSRTILTGKAKSESLEITTACS